MAERTGVRRADEGESFAHETDQATIGLLLCKSKTNDAAPIGVAEWQTQIPKNLPEELASSLHSVEQLEAELAADVWEDES